MRETERTKEASEHLERLAQSRVDVGAEVISGVDVTGRVVLADIERRRTIFGVEDGASWAGYEGATQLSSTLPDDLSEMRVVGVVGSVIGRFIHPWFDRTREYIGFVTSGSGQVLAVRTDSTSGVLKYTPRSPLVSSICERLTPGQRSSIVDSTASVVLGDGQITNVRTSDESWRTRRS